MTTLTIPTNLNANVRVSPQGSPSCFDVMLYMDLLLGLRLSARVVSNLCKWLFFSAREMENKSICVMEKEGEWVDVL